MQSHDSVHQRTTIAAGELQNVDKGSFGFLPLNRYIPGGTLTSVCRNQISYH